MADSEATACARSTPGQGGTDPVARISIPSRAGGSGGLTETRRRPERPYQRGRDTCPVGQRTWLVGIEGGPSADHTIVI